VGASRAGVHETARHTLLSSFEAGMYRTEVIEVQYGKIRLMYDATYSINTPYDTSLCLMLLYPISARFVHCDVVSFFHRTKPGKMLMTWRRALKKRPPRLTKMQPLRKRNELIEVQKDLPFMH